jgi:cation transport ATPase
VLSWFAVASLLALFWSLMQNLAFAWVCNELDIPLAAGLLYPFTGWLQSPRIAALAMSLSSVPVIASALRLRVAGIAAPQLGPSR